MQLAYDVQTNRIVDRMSCPDCGRNTLVNVTRVGESAEFHCYECNYHGDGVSGSLERRISKLEEFMDSILSLLTSTGQHVRALDEGLSKFAEQEKDTIKTLKIIQEYFELKEKEKCR